MPDCSGERKQVIAKTVALVGTLDTKWEEFAFLRDRIESSGLRTLLVNAGVFADPPSMPTFSRAAVAEAGNENLEALIARQDRGHSVEVMAAGSALIIRRLFEEGAIQGIVSLGGSAGTTIATAAMRALPVGFPKLMVSTLASGDTKPYVGTKDICMMYSVVDIAGLNTVSRAILSNAAAAICGMVTSRANGFIPRKTQHRSYHVRGHHPMRDSSATPA